MIQPLESWDSEATLATFHDGTFEQWVMGRRVQKSRGDMKRLLAVIDTIRPEAIIETGTRWGGSAMWFAQTAGCPVYSIDVAPQLGWTAKNRDQADHGITYHIGDSLDPRIFDKVRREVEGKRVLIDLDSDHHADHVLGEIFLWGQLVEPGGVLVVEDACFDMWEGDDARRGAPRILEEGGPLKAIDQSGLDIKPEWQRMIDIEGMYPISHSPCGWWRRR